MASALLPAKSKHLPLQVGLRASLHIAPAYSQPVASDPQTAVHANHFKPLQPRPNPILFTDAENPSVGTITESVNIAAVRRMRLVGCIGVLGYYRPPDERSPTG